MKLDLQYDLINETPASATPVESNFNRLEQFTNQEMINRDGSVAMTGALKLFGNPIAPLDAVPKQYVDTLLPIGSMTMFAGAAAPPGGTWLLCDGAELQQSTYPDLYNVIGTTYTPSGSPAGHFNLPNLSGRMPLGVSPSDAIGANGGARDAPIVNHVHNMNHKHGDAWTSVENITHVHAGINHLHTGTTDGMNANHTHGHPAPSVAFVGVGPAGSGLGGTTSTINSLHADSNTGYADSTHVHTFTSGAADRDLTTGGQNVSHQHFMDTPAFGGNTANATSGVPATNANLPPYLVVNYLIRAL